jgi:UDP-N-acetyl-D-mannosaminuronate dehydrogenase
VPELDEFGLSSAPLEPEAYDCVVIVTAHGGIDYADVVSRGQVIVDFRNATGVPGRESQKVWKL